MTVEDKLRNFKNFFADFKDEKDENKRYLIHFKPANLINELKIYITNGSNQWYFSLNEKSYGCSSKKYVEYLDEFYDILKKKKIQLHKIYNSETNKDLIKFEIIYLEINYYFQPNDIYEPIDQLTELIFELYDKCGRLETNLSLNEQNNENEKSNRNVPGVDTKKSNVSGLMMMSHTQRKPGMSIINPHSRRRKVPKGVQFGDNDDNSDESSTD